MKTFVTVLSLAFFLSGTAPLEAAATPHAHRNMKASKRKPYKIKRAKIHRNGH